MAVTLPSYPSLEDQVVFINGGSSGIGAEMVRAFAGQGAKVGFWGRDRGAAESLIDTLHEVPRRPSFFACGVTDVTALQETLGECSKTLGDIGVLVNSVGNDDRHDIETVDVDYFDWMSNINLRPHVFAIQQVIPGMRRLGGGSIINLGSIAPLRKNEGAIVYTALKAAIHGMTRGMARRLGPDRIRVNTLVPGWTMTDKQRRLWLDEAGEKAMDESLCLPGRVHPEDIAAAALFLASDQSRMMTAQDLIVDGGWT
ncbi:MAG: SDR family NAD(P)-dependent oxidoreductase [Ruegeria sp.]